MTATVAPVAPHTFPAAGLDRRFYAFTIDRAVAWAIDGLAVVVAWQLFLDDGRWVPGLAVVVVGVLLVTGLFSVQTGLTGTSPGKAALGLRVVDVETGAALGVRSALIRSAVVGVATLPTFGLGAATLAWTATMDRDRQRRGWHDHVTGAVVVDVRPVPEVVEEVDEGPRQIVNLTALRLVPAPPPNPVATPVPAASPGRAERPTAPVPEPLADPEPAPAPPPAVPPPPPRETPTGTQPVPVVPARQLARWRVQFDSGESFEVEGLALVGRRPEPRPGEPVRHLVPLPSGDMSLSKTHAQFQVAPDGALVAMDRGSTNGSVLIRSGASRQLPPGKPMTLLAGDEVRFGDRRMTVTRES